MKLPVSRHTPISPPPVSVFSTISKRSWIRVVRPKWFSRARVMPNSWAWRAKGCKAQAALCKSQGFGSGDVVGIKLERRLAFGHIVLRVFSLKKGKKLAKEIRDHGFAVTTFPGEGRSGPVTELYIVCRRRDLKKLIGMVIEVEPKAFYITEQAGDVSKIYRPFMGPATGWRAILKKK